MNRSVSRSVCFTCCISLWKASTAVDQAEDLAFCRGLFDEIISIAAPAESNAIDPGHVIGALEFMKDNGDIQPEVVVDLQNLLSKVRVGHIFPGV